ncbi:FAD binding domain protein [Pseudozyma hubeiensis SY62]|uniref:FAD binding domain protein n=1 Tax=Pseudozyma hubeiensis (strain SY62) TaxID=1305764 RepID=R9NY85_PSEHS|nr:FAD binding domain protein [Pseudozyma hubeiensis SY62]GAC93562.1 FAD binding domain protein [Pseudozyma hubeiensis SY62]
MLPPHRKTPDTLIMPEDFEAESSCTSSCDSAAAPTSRLLEPDTDATAHFDLVIIGAGPAALAVVSRILESRPAALYTEDEHRHLHFTHRRKPALLPSKVAKTSTSSNRTISKTLQDDTRRREQKTGKGLWNLKSDDGDLCGCDGRIKILVIDKLGEGFMGLWRRNFSALGITHLRSPMFFHPDASDFDALIAYANQQGQAGEGTPDQVIGMIEGRLAAGGKPNTAKGRSCRRRSKDQRSPSLVEAPDVASAHKCETQESRLPDLIEILGVVGKEKSKHKRKQMHNAGAAAATNTKVHVNERDRRDYFTPSSALFDSFTHQLERRYRVQSNEGCLAETWPRVSQFFEHGVDGDIEPSESSGEESAGPEDSPVTTLKGIVQDLVWFDGSKETIQDDFGNHSPGFLLSLADSPEPQSSRTIISAKAVVSAVAFGGVPMLPSYLTATPSHSISAPPPPACGPGWMHSSCLANLPFPVPPSSSPAHQRRMVVVGGGLTSAQIVVRALENGYDKVILLTRGHLKSKPFDVDLGWVGRYSNFLKMQFWQNDDVQERLNMLRAARNGGSVTPTYAKLLARLQALGKVEIWTHTTIASADYGSASTADTDNRDNAAGDKRWSLTLRTSTDGGKLTSMTSDYLLLATGAKIDFGALPFLRHLQTTHPIRLAGGLPVLTADLEYRRDVPLFVTGAYAGLQIGPAAGNLGGMRDSADRIANRLLELLSLPQGVVPGVVSLPETVVPRSTVAGAVKVEEEERREVDSSQVKTSRKDRVKVGKGSAFTHFNFDVLSIEA